MNKNRLLGIVAIVLMVSGISIATWRVLTRDDEKPEAQVSAEREWVLRFNQPKSGTVLWASAGYNLRTWLYHDDIGNPPLIIKNPPLEITNGCKKCTYRFYCSADTSHIWLKVTYSSENFSVKDEPMKILWFMKITEVRKIETTPCREHQ